MDISGSPSSPFLTNPASASSLSVCLSVCLSSPSLPPSLFLSLSRALSLSFSRSLTLALSCYLYLCGGSISRICFLSLFLSVCSGFSPTCSLSQFESYSETFSPSLPPPPSLALPLHPVHPNKPAHWVLGCRDYETSQARQYHFTPTTFPGFPGNPWGPALHSRFENISSYRPLQEGAGGLKEAGALSRSLGRRYPGLFAALRRPRRDSRIAAQRLGATRPTLHIPPQ